MGYPNEAHWILTCWQEILLFLIFSENLNQIYGFVVVVVVIYLFPSKKKIDKGKILGEKGKFCLGVQNEAGERLIEFYQDNTLVIANTLFQQHKRRLYTWTSQDGQYQNQIDYILCSQRWSSIQSAKTRPGAACGTDHELLIAFSSELNWRK